MITYTMLYWMDNLEGFFKNTQEHLQSNIQDHVFLV